MAENEVERSTSRATQADDEVLEQMENAVPHDSSSGSEDKAGEKQAAQQQQKPEEPKKPSKLKQIWEKLGLDL